MYGYLWWSTALFAIGDADGSPSLAAPRRSWQTVAKAKMLQQTLLNIH
jgi:hypothetical protein